MKLKDFFWMFEKTDITEIYINDKLETKCLVRDLQADYKYIDLHFESFEYTGYKNKVGLLKIYLKKEEENDVRI